MKVKSESEVAQLCPTVSDLMDWSLPGSSIRGIFQAKVLEWGVIAFSARPIYVTANGITVSPLRTKPSSCKLSTFKDVNICLHVQLHKLAHMSGVHCYLSASSTSNCPFVYFTVQHCLESSSRVSLFQVQDVQKQV